MGNKYDDSNVPVPGTTDLLGSDSDKDALILHPQPSSDPDDPLNWSPRRKALATACTTIYTFFNGFAGSNLYSILSPLSKARPVLTLSVLNAGTGYLFLLAGLGLLFWQPLALQYGKRPVYLLSMAGLLGMSVWAVYVRNSGEWYARSILFGFFAAPVEALPEASVADLYFVHERGRYMTLYAAAVVGSNFAGPLVCGFIEAGKGWPWVFWCTTIFCGACFVFLFFAMEETNYDRVERVTTRDSSDLQHKKTHLATGKSKKSYVQKLALLDKPRPFAVHKHLGRQLMFLTWPVPLYAGFAYGSCLIWFNVLNATSSSILSAPPYSFSSSIVGLSYLAPLIGVAIVLLTLGPLSDALALRLARANNGRAEPEHRLYLFIAVTALVPAGLLLWGEGAAAPVAWPGLLFAMAFLGAQNAAGAALSVTYLVDTYRALAGDALTAVIVVRNVMSFAVSYGITPWVQDMGLRKAFGLAAAVGFVASLAWVPIVLFGKSLRARSGERYWRLVERHDAQERACVRDEDAGSEGGSPIGDGEKA